MAKLEVNDQWQREMKPFFVDLPGRPDEAMMQLEEFPIWLERRSLPNPRDSETFQFARRPPGIGKQNSRD